MNLTFGKAVQWDILTENPCSNIVLPKNDEIVNYSELLSDTELHNLFDAIKKENDKMLRTIYAKLSAWGCDRERF